MSGTTRITCADFEAAIADPTAFYKQDFMWKVPPLRRYSDKVAIVGFTDHRSDALKLDETFELWGLNELYRYMPKERFHRWFEIHGREYLCEDDEGKRHIEALKSELGPVPIYMQKRHQDIPGSVEFPVRQMIEYFGGPEAIGADYFTNCPAEMLSFAIAMGYSEIHMYGVDMATNSEYGTQRPCCEFWLGRALGLGIKIHVPDMSDLLKCIGTYGYEDSGSVFSRKIQHRIKWLHQQDNELLRQIRGLAAEYQRQNDELTTRVHRYEGALEELRRSEEPDGDRITALEAEMKSTGDDLKNLEAEYRSKNEKLMASRNQGVGSINDCEFWLRSWSMKATMPGGGAIPDQETRAADPQTGIQAPSADGQALVTA